MSDPKREDLRIMQSYHFGRASLGHLPRSVTDVEFDAIARDAGYVKADGMPHPHHLLRELMDAVGVRNDGKSSPQELWDECINIANTVGPIARDTVDNLRVRLAEWERLGVKVWEDCPNRCDQGIVLTDGCGCGRINHAEHFEERECADCDGSGKVLRVARELREVRLFEKRSEDEVDGG